MQRAPNCCPHCSQPVRIQTDMWGPRYLYEGCGWTSEDGEHLRLDQATRTRLAYTPTASESNRAQESRHHS